MSEESAGFRKVAGARKYYKYSECDKGQKLVSAGLYVGPEEGKFGINHVFKQEDGQTISLNSAGHLNWLLEDNTTAGKTVCNVYYDGKEMLTKGAMKGKEAHRFELEVREPQTHVVSKVKDTEPAKMVQGTLALDDQPDISL